MKYVLSAICLLAATSAQASTIDFETYSDGDLVTAVSSDDGLISANLQVFGGANEARAFDTTIATHDPDLKGPFVNDLDRSVTSSPGNVLIIQEEASVASGTPDDNADGGKIIFTFASVVDFLGFSIYDDARIKVTSDTGVSRTRSVSTDGQFNTFDLTGFTGVKTLTFNFKGHSGAIDDLRFATPDLAEPEPVPLPAGLPLLLAGLGAIGIVSKRRKAA